MAQKRQTIIFNERLVEMADELMQEKGYRDFTSVVHSGIIELYNKTFPVYARATREPETVEQKMQRKAEEKKIKENAIMDECRDIARELGGEVIIENGKEFVTYYTYSLRTRYLQKVPLQLMSTDLLKTQYQPSREKVEKLQRENKTDY